MELLSVGEVDCKWWQWTSIEVLSVEESGVIDSRVNRKSFCR